LFISLHDGDRRPPATIRSWPSRCEEAPTSRRRSGMDYQERGAPCLRGKGHTRSSCFVTLRRTSDTRTRFRPERRANRPQSAVPRRKTYSSNTSTHANTPLTAPKAVTTTPPPLERGKRQLRAQKSTIMQAHPRCECQACDSMHVFRCSCVGSCSRSRVWPGGWSATDSTRVSRTSRCVVRFRSHQDPGHGPPASYSSQPPLVLSATEYTFSISSP